MLSSHSLQRALKSSTVRSYVEPLLGFCKNKYLINHLLGPEKPIRLAIPSTGGKIVHLGVAAPPSVTLSRYHRWVVLYVTSGWRWGASRWRSQLIRIMDVCMEIQFLMSLRFWRWCSSMVLRKRERWQGSQSSLRSYSRASSRSAVMRRAVAFPAGVTPWRSLLRSSHSLWHCRMTKLDTLFSHLSCCFCRLS
jgi:hypothetical protein